MGEDVCTEVVTSSNSVIVYRLLTFPDIACAARCPVKQMMLGKMRDGISVHLSA